MQNKKPKVSRTKKSQIWPRYQLPLICPSYILLRKGYCPINWKDSRNFHWNVILLQPYCGHAFLIQGILFGNEIFTKDIRERVYYTICIWITMYIHMHIKIESVEYIWTGSRSSNSIHIKLYFDSYIHASLTIVRLKWQRRCALQNCKVIHLHKEALPVVTME